MAVSTYLKDKLLRAVFLATSFSVTTVYISLHTGDPSTSGANEVVGGTYARQLVAFAMDGTNAESSANETWSDLPAGTITHIGAWDAVTAGNFLLGGALSEPFVVSAGGEVVLTTEHIVGAVA